MSFVGSIFNRMGAILACRTEDLVSIRLDDGDGPKDLLTMSFTAMHPDAPLPLQGDDGGEHRGATRVSQAKD